MGSTKILWSPYQDDIFLTYGSAINLYKLEKIPKGQVPRTNQGMKLSDDVYATHLATNSEIQFMKCVAWYPCPEPENLIAIGQANGKVVLTSFGQPGNSDMVGREFIPKHLRQCNYLEWNPVDNNLLAEGLEKYRNDPCVVIWDVTSKYTSELTSSSEGRQRYSSSNVGDTVTKPYGELGSSETSTSFAWFYSEPKTFVTGMNNKSLKLFDLRDTSRAHLIAQTRSVYGVCIDPQDDWRLASFSETQVVYWDVRNFDKPLLTLQESRPVIKINWCPTRMGFLAVLCRDSSVVKLYDIRHSVIGTEELEPTIIERNVQPYGPHAVASFCWHPTNENRLLTVTPTGNLRDITVFERIPVILSSSFHVTWACGKRMIDLEYDNQGPDVDISVIMKQRALKGYGLHINQVMNNGVVAEDERHLQGLWSWLSLVRTMVDESSTAMTVPKRQQPKSSMGRYMGVKGLLKLDNMDAGGPRSELMYCYWQGQEGLTIPNSRPIKQYKCEERFRALQLCEWGYGNDNQETLMDLLQSLQLEKEYERAAAIALFNLKIGRALEILSSTAVYPEGGNRNLNAVAMALAGFTEDKNALWKKTCTSLRHQLTNPYLKAMFAFLAGDKENYDDVLKEEPGMEVKDRVAFACLFLNDQKLWEYLEELGNNLKTEGNLDGLLLTGLSQEGVDLLEQYVDKTGDVQTAALAAVYTFPNEIAKDPKVKVWIENYCILLDRWKLWHQRAKFDIIRHASDSSMRVQAQAYVSCNFCGKSIACNMQLARRVPLSSPLSPVSSHKPKITCCPGCRKPLPRCALCLTNLGTPSGSALYQQKETSEFENKLSSFGHWFTWCQTCRHGGHAVHLTEWFHEHSECPVTGCHCKCMTLDPIGRLSADSSVTSERS